MGERLDTTVHIKGPNWCEKGMGNIGDFSPKSVPPTGSGSSAPKTAPGGGGASGGTGSPSSSSTVGGDGSK